MTLSEAFEKLMNGAKLTYPGLDGYIQIKDNKLVTELYANQAFERDDWQEVQKTTKDYAEPRSKSQRIRIALDHEIGSIVDSRIKPLFDKWKSKLKGLS